MKDSFYSAFEKKYRGSRELIGKRLEAYIPIITPLLSVYPQANALDLGCGRGEWLEMVTRLGFDASGVDLDEGMLSYCVELNLKVKKADAITSLKALPDDSVALISSFHLVEHIGFENVRSLIDEALRVLKPGGIIILETPNAENIQVGTHNFHLDPTHDKPIPHQLLQFVADYAGFHRSKIMRLQEPEHISLKNPDISLSDVLLSVSPDYSVVAQKNADESILKQFDAPFDINYGVSLIELVRSYDEKAQIKEDARNTLIETMQEEISELKNNTNKLNDFISSTMVEERIRLELENAKLKADLIELKAVFDRKSHDYDVVSTDHHHVVFSRSWKMTKPYRYVGRQLKFVVHQGPKERSKIIIKRILVALNHRLNNHPGLKAKLIKFVKNTGLEKVARRIYRKAQSAPPTVYMANQDLGRQLNDPSLMPPEVKEIFSKLK